MTTPTNPYYQETFNAAVGSLARSRALEAEFASIQRAFDLIKLAVDEVQVAGTSRFIELLDCPDVYTNAGLKLVRVNAAASGLEFAAPGKIPLVNVTASRNLLASDAGKLLTCNSATAMTLTIQPNASIPIDTETTVVVAQWGAGKVTLAPGSGVTLRSAGGLLATRVQFSQITLIKTATDEWLIGGDLAL